MEEKLKYIATDSKSFRELIEDGYLYIDKTEHLYKMLRKGSPSKYWFLSRPRRFGKSLLIDTLENIFKGNRELFKGTYIYDNYDFEEHPVIRFSMNDLRGSSNEVNKRLLIDLVVKWASYFHIEDNIDISIDEPFYYFSNLLKAVYRKTGKKVVVLIDEYDYPLMQSVKEKEKFEEMSSTDQEYAAICGYTDDEIDHYFAPYMEKYFSDNNIADENERSAFRTRMKEFYDGYRFSEDSDVTLYNPVSIGRFFIGGCRFKNYWVETGSQSIVNEMIEKHRDLFRDKDEFDVGDVNIQFEVSRLFRSPSEKIIYAYLMQAGYLTIKEKREGRSYLCYPNEEVRDTMNSAVLAASYGIDVLPDEIVVLREYFVRENTVAIIEKLKAIYRTFPYHMSVEKERLYHAILHTLLIAVRLDARAEEPSAMGRADEEIMVSGNIVYIIELKLDKSAEEALNQIKVKKYYEKYAKDGAVIHLLGINFSSQERNITEWKEEIIQP